MAAQSQPSVRDSFSKVNPDEFRSQIDSRSASFIQPVTREEQKEYQKGRKRQNMRDSRDRRKVKEESEVGEGHVESEVEEVLDINSRQYYSHV